MASRMFLHINGTTYLMHRMVESERDIDFLEARDTVKKLVAGSESSATFDVWIDDRPARLFVGPGVWAGSLFLGLREVYEEDDEEDDEEDSEEY